MTLGDYLYMAEKDPSTIEIFDFLNGGIADTITDNKLKNDDIELFAQLDEIEDKIENIQSIISGKNKKVKFGSQSTPLKLKPSSS